MSEIEMFFLGLALVLCPFVFTYLIFEWVERKEERKHKMKSKNLKQLEDRLIFWLKLVFISIGIFAFFYLVGTIVRVLTLFTIPFLLLGIYFVGKTLEVATKIEEQKHNE